MSITRQKPLFHWGFWIIEHYSTRIHCAIESRREPAAPTGTCMFGAQAHWQHVHTSLSGVAVFSVVL
jgi:hypothetical protein